MEENPRNNDLILLKSQTQKEITRAKKKLEKQKIEYKESANWETYKNFADTILINKNLIKKGMNFVELADESTQLKMKIELNRTLSAVENAEMYYRKSRKGKRSCEICVEKTKETENEIANLEKLLEKICYFIDNGFAERENEAENLLSMRHSSKTVQAAKVIKNDKKTSFRHYNYKGYDIYAGKTSGDNDELSVKFANPSDIWFHAAGFAGSHLIIRRKKGDPMPPNDVLSVAGGIAVFFSKAKNSGYTEVNMTEARFVRKPRKSPAGIVIAERCKTIRVLPIDPQKLFKEQNNEN
ncbi:MAG: NFACT RNA binding domain-containing protein [Chitinispirillales bacterium]|jgi:predicted ribosome quality control (RQC) complex YloA/Tae2 family protein|nr:NFACT RNA binding domain-containing protein [Chitinispirillales bacterium]